MARLAEESQILRLDRSGVAVDDEESRIARFIRTHPVLLVFLVALGARVVVAFFLTVVFGGSLVPDDSTYSRMAEQVAEGERGAWDAYTHELYRRTFAFLAPLALIYSVVAPEPLAGQLFVGLLGGFTAAATALIALEFLKAGWAIVAGLIVTLLPSQVLWSSLILKDASVWFALASLGVVVAIASRSIGWRLLPLAGAAAVLLVGLGHLREHTLVVASFALALASVAGISRHRLLRIVGAVVLAVCVPWLVGIGPAGFTLITDAGSLEQRRMLNAEGARTAFVEAKLADPVDPQQERVLVERIAALQAKAAELRLRAEQSGGKESGGDAGSGGGENTEQELLQAAVSLEEQATELRGRLPEQDTAGAPAEEATALDPNLAHLPTGLAVMLLEPVPWETEGSSSLRMARLEALVWYPLLILGLVGLWASRKHLRSLAFPILAGGGVLFVYALTEGNIGTAFRHRGEFVWVVALLAALGLHQLVSRRQQRRSMTTEGIER